MNRPEMVVGEDDVTICERHDGDTEDRGEMDVKRERDRQRAKESERERERARESERERKRARDSERQRERARESERESLVTSVPCVPARQKAHVLKTGQLSLRYFLRL